MKNKTAGSFTLLVTLIAFTGALLLAAGPVLSAGPVGTKTKSILAAFSPVQPKRLYKKIISVLVVAPSRRS